MNRDMTLAPCSFFWARGYAKCTRYRKKQCRDTIRETYKKLAEKYLIEGRSETALDLIADAEREIKSTFCRNIRLYEGTLYKVASKIRKERGLPYRRPPGRIYNKGVLNSLKTSLTHISRAKKRLCYGILKQDFKEELMNLTSIENTIIAFLDEKESG